MREILFRGKRVDNGEWVEGYYVFRGVECGGKDTHHFILVHDEYGFSWREVDPETVCQYTGLTDKAGKKIFDGDIVEGYDCEFYEVAYSEDEALFELRQNGCSMETFTSFYTFDCKVIGNIFDNPELLATSSTDSD